MIKKILLDELLEVVELIVHDARADWERELQRSNQVVPRPYRREAKQSDSSSLE